MSNFNWQHWVLVALTVGLYLAHQFEPSIADKLDGLVPLLVLMGINMPSPLPASADPVATLAQAAGATVAPVVTK